ncbi:MAG: hypothetical protein COS95_03535 [Ignavibacteriales bacterium CG07_land_8_20_14_0_80_59_12]|nr:MAG: hypothetical protein COS95_03535 [Ignavibacteriales bacterium CG07_land_8_20_14_0_80_59_12]
MLGRLLAACVLGTTLLSAQTSVDRLVSRLDSLVSTSYNDWKVSPDLKIAKLDGKDPQQAGFDDSKWDNLKLNERIYPDSCWIRKTIVLPQTILGVPISGPAKFLVSVDDYGYMWINGESRGYFPWDGEFELTKNGKPGDTFLIAIRAINTSGPLRIIRAEIETENTAPLLQSVRDFALSMRVGQKLTGFDTYQTSSNNKVDPGTDKSKMSRDEKKRLGELLQTLAARVDVDALARGSVDGFTVSLKSVKSELKPISEFAKRYTLFFDSNAHIDAAWLWREKETIEVCKNTFSSVMNMFNARPDFTYTQSSAAYYDWMERLYPDLFRQIQQHVKDRRWEVIGGMWVEPDCNLPSGESWARHLLYAKRYFRSKLGEDVKIGWNPDSFGYNWNMPQFYKNAGIDAFITQKIGWNAVNVFPYRVFWWEAPEKSTILSYFPFDYVSQIEDPYRLVDWMRQFDANTGFTKLLVLFGVGDHGGGPSLAMIDRIEHLKTLDIFPSIDYGTATQYIDWLKKQDLSSLPTWDDELYLEYHQGTYTTQAKMKENNRKSEVLLTNAERFSSLATMFGRKYNSADLESAWRNVMFNQFHDILPGSSIREVYTDAPERYKQAYAVGDFQLRKSLEQIASQVNTAKLKKGKPVVVFNPLSWDRNDIVRVKLDEGDLNDYAVFDARGKEIPSQAVSKGEYKREVIFIADKVPSLGYALYELRPQKSAAAGTALHATPAELENDDFRIAIDSDSGWVKSIFDKRNNREVLSGFGNKLQLLEDRPSAWDAWNIGLTGREFPSTFKGADVLESGPVRVVLRLRRTYLKPGVKKDLPTEDFPSSFFTQDIILYNGVDRIDFATDVDWWEEKTMLKVAFPLTVSDTVASYEVPFGTIERSTQMRNSWEQAKVEVPAERWADLSQNDYGVSLLNNSKYGYDIKGNSIRLSLLRSPIWPDPTADRGKHHIEYSLYPHSGRWRDASTLQYGYDFNYPLLAVVTDKHAGKLPAEESFVKVSPSNIVLTTVKKAEDSDAWIIQWYDAKGVHGEATVTLPMTPKKVVMSNFMEDDGAPVPFEKNVLKVHTMPNSVVTVKVTF